MTKCIAVVSFKTLTNGEAANVAALLCGQVSKLTLPQRNRAIQKVRKLVDDARELGGLVDPEYTAERLEYLENNLCAGLLFNHPETPPASGSDVPFGRKIEPAYPTEPETQPTQNEQSKPEPGDEPEWKLEDQP